MNKYKGEFLRKRMIELHEKNQKTQFDMATLFFVNKSTISRMESGNTSYKKIVEFAEKYCDALGLTEQQKANFMRGQKVIVTDTSALLKNTQLIDELSKEYSKVIVPSIVLDKFDNIKAHSSRCLASIAWQIIRSIGSNSNVMTRTYIDNGVKKNNDSKIIDIVEKASEEFHCLVDIITYDAVFSARLRGSKCVRALFLEEYLVIKQGLVDINSLVKLNNYYADSYENIETKCGITLPNKDDINAYLPPDDEKKQPAGYTLIISVVRNKQVPLLQRKEKNQVVNWAWCRCQ